MSHSASLLSPQMNNMTIIVPATVIVFCTLFGLFALKAGSIALASFFAVICLQGWLYITYLAAYCFFSVFKIVRQ